MAAKLKAQKAPLTVPDTTPSRDTVSMFAPEGRFVEVPLSDAGTLAAAGFRPDTPELREQLALEGKYGGLGGEIASAGLGLASGLTLGLSKPILRQAGVAVDEYERVNPDAFLAGEVGSFLVPALGSVKALGAAGKVARGAGALQTGVSSVGDAAAKIVAKKISSDIAQSAAKMGTEGLLYGAAHAGSEILDDVLQDKELKAEALLAHAGSTATAGLIGFGLGIAFPLIGKATRKLAESAGEAGKKFFDPERSRQLFTGSMQKELREDTGERFQQAVKELGEGGLYRGGEIDLDGVTGRITQTAKGTLPNAEAVLGRQQMLKPKVIEAMSEATAAADAAAAAAGMRPAAAQWGMAEAKFASDKINAWRNVAQITEQEADRMMATVNEISQAAQRTNGSLKAMHALRKGLDARIGPKNWAALKSEEIELVKDLRRVLSRKMDDAFVELEQAGVNIDGGAWKRLNRLYSNLKTIEEPLNRAIARANANVNVAGLRFRDIGIGAIAGGVFDNGMVGLALGAANKAIQTDRGLLLRAEIGEWLNKRASTSAKQWSAAAQKLLEPAGEAVERGSLLSAERLADDWFTPLQAQLSGVAADPLGAADALTADTAPVREQDPELADALVAKQMRIYSYLYEQMPKPSAGVNMLGKPWKPTPAQLQSFAKVVRTAENPNTIFADIAAGTASREQVKALQALYPATHRQLVDAVMQQLLGRTEPLPYATQLRISRLLGVPISKYLQPQFVARMQSIRPSAGPADENSSMGRVTLAADNLMSDTQRVEARNIR